jgi:hypothetical protein
MKLEHQGHHRQLTDEQLDQAIAMIEEMLARRGGNDAKVIEGEGGADRARSRGERTPTVGGRRCKLINGAMLRCRPI